MKETNQNLLHSCSHYFSRLFHVNRTLGGQQFYPPPYPIPTPPMIRDSNGITTHIYVDDGNSKLSSPSRSTTTETVSSSLLSSLESTFLPSNMPPAYYQFQLFDTLQGLSSYLRNIITTSAVLQSIGVGSDAASPLAAALQWSLKDGAGLLTSLAFSHALAEEFNGFALQFRLFADVINDVGMTLDMFLPLVPPHLTLYYAFLSTG